MQPVLDPMSMAAVARPVVELVTDQRCVLAQGDGDSLDIGVPIEAEGQLLAVLVLPDVVANELNTDMVALLTRFGAAAGAALLNARRYEAAMFLLDVAH